MSTVIAVIFHTVLGRGQAKRQSQSTLIGIHYHSKPGDKKSQTPRFSLHSTSTSLSALLVAIMADDAEAIHAAELKKKRQFRKYAYRGIDLENLLDKSSEEVLPTLIVRLML
jgi:hypothetical protein